MSFWSIVEDVQSLVPVFQNSIFVHAHRICNVVADALAKTAKNLLGTQVWFDDILEDIFPLVVFDVP